MISIVLVDDQPTVRQGLRMRLALEPDMQVLGEAGCGTDAIALVTALRPDVVVLDIEMPGGDGFAVITSMQEHESPPVTVILTIYDDIATRERAKSLGAFATVGKHEGSETLLSVIRMAAHRAGP